MPEEDYAENARESKGLAHVKNLGDERAATEACWCPVCENRLRRAGRLTCGDPECVYGYQARQERGRHAHSGGWPRLTEPAPLSETAFANNVSSVVVGSAPARPATLPLTRSSIA